MHSLCSTTKWGSNAFAACPSTQVAALRFKSGSLISSCYHHLHLPRALHLGYVLCRGTWHNTAEQAVGLALMDMDMHQLAAQGYSVTIKVDQLVLRDAPKCLYVHTYL